MNAVMLGLNLAHRRLVVRHCASVHGTERAANPLARRHGLRQFARLIARRVFVFGSGDRLWQACYLSGRQVISEVAP